MLGKDGVLEGVVVVGPHVGLGEDPGSPLAEHESHEALGGRVEVAREDEAFIEGRPGGAEDDRTAAHGTSVPSATPIAGDRSMPGLKANAVRSMFGAADER